MNDFAQQKNSLFWGKVFSGGVSQVNRALDAVAKAKFFGQADGELLAGGEDVSVGAEVVDNVASVVGDDLRLHFFHDFWAS